MERKYLTESARISDAYAQMYAKKPATRTPGQINESASKVPAAYKGDLSIEGKGSAKTGSKLGRRPVLPFDKRDAKNTCGHAVPMKKTFGNGLVKKGPTDTTTIGHTVPAKTGSKLGVRKVMPFEKRDPNATKIGRVGKLRDVSCSKRIKESEDKTNGVEQGKDCGQFEGKEPIHNPNTKPINNISKGEKDKPCVEATEDELNAIGNVGDFDAFASSSTEDGDKTMDGGDEGCECCDKCKDAIELALTTFEELYDGLSDEDKELVDSAKSELEKCLEGGDEDDSSSADDDGSAPDDDEGDENGVGADTTSDDDK